MVGGDPSPSSDELTTARQSARWDEFHQHHDAGDFFKERRYLLAEFPALAVDAPTTILEIGCGSGSSCVPILRANPRARVLACDFSPAAVRCTARAAARLDLADRLAAFTCDPARENLAAAAAAAAADAGFPADAPIRAACLVFVLSAVPPDALPAFLDSVRRAVSPGGVVFFRDYGVYDLPMLRFAPSARRESRVYARGDGTSLAFSSSRKFRDAFANAGFEEVTDPNGAEPVRYCCVHNENRKKGIKMRRVFVHGVFRRSREPNDPDDFFSRRRKTKRRREKGYED